MESKKINQLATELAPDLSDITIIGDPTTGVSKKITLSQMASLFTGTVEEYANFAAFPLVGVADTIYVAKDTNVIYRWDSTAYVVLSPNVIASLVFNDANGFDGTISLVGSVATLTITTALTTGSVPFIGASGALTQDNSNLFFDDTNNRLGIATASPTTPLDVFGSGIIGRLNATSTNNAYLGFASNGTNKWSAGNVQSDHRFRIFSEANSAELITILQTGEFGIGIANPTTKFHIDGAASALIANLDANVSIAKSVSFRSDNSARINLEVSGTESGSNVGADFFLRTFTDAGSLLETPFTIVRSTGVTTIKSLTLTNVLSVANGGTGSATQNFVDLTTTQSIGGAKTFTSALAGTSATFSGNVNIGTAGSERLNIFGAGSQFINVKNTTTNADMFVGMSSALSSGFIGTGGTDNLVLSTGGVVRLTLNGSTGAATFSSSVTATAFIPSGATIPTNGMYLSAANTLNFATNSTNRLFITSSGFVTIGGTASSRRLQVNTSGNDGIRIVSSNDNPVLDLMQTAAANVNARNWRIVSNWDGWGTLDFQSGTTNTQDPATTRLTISGVTGNVGIGGGDSIVRLNIVGAGATSATYSLYITNSAPTPLFYVRNDGRMNTGLATASPYNDTTANAANMNVDSAGFLNRSTASSLRFKENINDWNESGIETILALKPKTFTYKADYYKNPDVVMLGLIAEEVAEVSPYLAEYENEDRTGQVENVRYANIVVPLIKAIQEQQAQIEELKALINK